MENLILTDIIVHEIFRRADGGGQQSPRLSDNVVALDPMAMSALQSRVVGAAGKESHSVNLDIVDMTKDSAFFLSKTALNASKIDFVQKSKELANLLHKAQTTRSIPGGVVVVFRGTVGVQNVPVLGIIKAERNGGFTRDVDGGGNVLLTYINDLFLTGQTRLYKIGIFAFGINDVGAIVYDENITARDKHGASMYFYETFLGCAFPEDNAKRTKDFFLFTRDFINKLNIGDAEKVDLHTSLYTYLKVDQSPNVHSAQFAQNYLPQDIVDPYKNYMVSKSFPANAVTKDLADINLLLKRRSLKFSNNIRFSAPEGVFEDLVEISVIDPQGTEPQKTIITVKDKLVSQS